MGQLFAPSSGGITVNPSDRESGPGAGSGATGNNSIFLGANAGKNSTISQFIAIGNNTGSAGLSSTANLNGTTLVGAQSAESLTTGYGDGVGVTLLGSGNLNAASQTDSSTIVGSAIMSTYLEGSQLSVFIGQKILNGNPGNSTQVVNSNLIGSNILNSTVASFINVSASTLIGDNIGSGMINGSGMSGAIIIGHNAGGSITQGATSSVLIGSAVDTAPNGASNVVIGAGANQSGANATDSYLVEIGSNASSIGNLNTVLGYAAKTAANAAGLGNVVIGGNAGQTLTALLTNVLVIEASTLIGGGSGNVPSALVYGNFASGNLVLGNSTFAASNRDTGGAGAANILKLLNGTIGAANPLGGGYFYVSGGILRWVDSAGTNTQLSMTTAGQLAGNSITAYANNAAGNAGTLTNAPAIGNPTKWIPINDAGTIRNVPAW